MWTPEDKGDEKLIVYHEDVVYESLALLKKSGYSLDFDLVKVSHHGSNNNISSRILNLITSKRYLISTNGKHTHPDLSTIAKIVEAGNQLEIITNYHQPKLEKFIHELDSNQKKIKLITTNEIVME